MLTDKNECQLDMAYRFPFFVLSTFLIIPNKAVKPLCGLTALLPNSEKHGDSYGLFSRVKKKMNTEEVKL